MARFHYYSIIVPSFNRREEIGELLQSLTSINFPRERFEVIIADDGSSDGTSELVNTHQKTTNLNIRMFRQDHLGPGAARNMGMKHAKGDFFIFVDSDCTVDHRWLAAIDNGLSEQDADAFGGPDSYRQDFPPLLKAINYSMTSFLTTGGIRGSKRRMGKFYPRSFNMGLSRQIYEKIGGFGDLRHGQDIEFSHRIIKSGARIVLIPDAIVFHKRRTSLRKFFRQVFNWGVARINLYKISPEMLEWVHALPALALLLFISLLVAGLFSNAIWLAFRWILLLGTAALVLSGVHAATVYRNFRMLYLVPIVIPIQIAGYGIGFLSAFVARVVFGHEPITGFQKKYY